MKKKLITKFFAFYFFFVSFNLLFEKNFHTFIRGFIASLIFALGLYWYEESVKRNKEKEKTYKEND